VKKGKRRSLAINVGESSYLSPISASEVELRSDQNRLEKKRGKKRRGKNDVLRGWKK